MKDMHRNVDSSIICNKPKLEATQCQQCSGSIVTYLYKGILYSLEYAPSIAMGARHGQISERNAVCKSQVQKRMYSIFHLYNIQG